MRVLVVNAGSTSVKLRLVEADDSISHSADLGPPGPDLDGEVDEFLSSAGRVDATGHRIVHGGPAFVAPVRVDDLVRRRLDSVTQLAPLHNPPALHALDALHRAAPDLPAVACFDTAFHAEMPEEARRYALPSEWVERWGIRRYGFHGLSCEWSLGRAASLTGRDAAALRLVICHLGGGASVTAVAGGRSVDTTMGFTPTEGLVMASRSGDVDPGAIAWLAEQGISGSELMDGLEHRSGLRGLSGGWTGDMRELLEARGRGHEVATGALAVYIHRLRAEITAMATSIGGFDTLVFTGGVGEGAAAVREEACAGLGWVGAAVDPVANRAVGGGGGGSGSGGGDAEITGPGSAVRIFVVQAREEVVVAGHCREILGAD